MWTQTNLPAGGQTRVHIKQTTRLFARMPGRRTAVSHTSPATGDAMPDSLADGDVSFFRIETHRVFCQTCAMNLDHLRAFLAVAEAGGFSKAASRASSTQPTMSRQVKALERELGRTLFHRLGRNIHLTEYGREVVDRARIILSQADALSQSGASQIERVSGLLRIGAADSVVMSRLPSILQKFHRKYKEVRVHIRAGSSPDILRWVREGRCDVGVCMIPEAHPGLTFRDLWKDKFVALAPPRHRLAGKTTSLEEFASERQLVIRAGTLSHQVITSAYQSAGLSLVPDMTFDSFKLIVAFVAAGLGVGIASSTDSKDVVRAGRVARVRIREIDRLSRRLGLVLHADRTHEGPLDAFLTEVE